MVKLRIDKALSVHDLLAFESNTLQSLELCRSNFVLPLNVGKFIPNLMSLRYSPSFRFEQSQIESMISAIPDSIKHLHLEVPSADADLVIVGISHRLRDLETLIIEGSYEMGIISGTDIYGCLIL